MDEAQTLAAMLSDVPAAAAHRYGVRDDAGRPLDCLKVQGSGPGRYLGVSHVNEAGTFNVYLSSSDDLLTWTSVRLLDADASQPTLEPDGAGGWLFADEATDGREGNFLRLRHYASTGDLLRGAHDRELEPPNALVRRGSAQGTPNLYGIELAPDIDHSMIGVGFHVFERRDLQASGTLEDFTRWTARRRPDLDARFAGAKGNVGDRDVFTFAGHPWAVHEAQLTRNDWGTWRLWLRDLADDSVWPLPVRTHGGSISFGNPTVTRLTLPDGRPGLVVTAYVFSPGAAPGEQGELVFSVAVPPGG